MLLPRKDAESVENAIERRLVETMVSGGVRPFHNAGPVRKANPAGTGLFLVKPAMDRRAGEMSSRAEKVKALRSGRLKANADRLAEEGKRPGRVIPMALSEKQARQDRLLGLMAALGPMLWFGHAALVWFKMV